ncbi:hypothetical protein ISS21_00890 [Patescibacteria group bacterium]|nr:hypothetical protein [Patescibacteria group bacterium]
MNYHFLSLKFYIAGLVVLVLIFLLSWLPKTHIDLIVRSEPLVMNLEVKLDISARGILFNLDTIPGRIVSSQGRENWPGYMFIDELSGEQGEKIIIFQEKDLQELVAHKIKALLDQPNQESAKGSRLKDIELEKSVLELHSEEWEIKVKDKDLLTGQGTILLSLEEEVVRKYDFESLKQHIKFRKITLVKEELKSLPSIKDVQIRPWPWFWRQISPFPDRINFSVTPLESSLYKP